MSAQVSEWLEVLEKILLRCWILGFLMLVIWISFFGVASNVIHDLHGKMFGLSPHELNVIHYCGIALAKLLVGMFFFFPWLSIRLVLRKTKV